MFAGGRDPSGKDVPIFDGLTAAASATTTAIATTVVFHTVRSSTPCEGISDLLARSLSLDATNSVCFPMHVRWFA